jgi:ubiquinone/menaquinone biosynthesis C-methylase UbiE
MLPRVTSTERIRHKYDQIADRYEEMFFYVADLGQQLVDYADPAPGARVLDVGAGRGACARAALARGCTVTAVDASAGMVQRLAQDYPEITARQLDAGRLDFADGAFDLVTAGFVLQVLDDPELALSEIRRVLAPGGTFALSVERQSLGRLRWLHELNIEFFAPGMELPEDDDGPLNAERTRALLSEAGFVDQHWRPVEMPLPMASEQELWNWLDSQGMVQAIESIPPERATEFRRRFFDGAEQMRSSGGIVLEFAATLHVAHSP